MKTDILIDLILWDKAKQRIKGNAPLVKEYNNTLLNLATSAWNHYNDAMSSGFRFYNPECRHCFCY